MKSKEYILYWRIKNVLFNIFSIFNKIKILLSMVQNYLSLSLFFFFFGQTQGMGKFLGSNLSYSSDKSDPQPLGYQETPRIIS